METSGTGKMMIKRLSAMATAVLVSFRRFALPVWRVLSYSLLEEIIPSAVIAVSIRKGYVDVLRAKRSFLKYAVIGVKVYNYAEEAFPSADEVASAAAAALKEFGLNRSDAVLLVPKSWVILKSAELPAAVSANLKDVIFYEFDRFTPFSASDAVYDYRAEYGSGETIGILLAAAREVFVKEYLEKLSAKMVSVRQLDFDLSAISTHRRFISGLDTFIFAEISAGVCGGGFVQKGVLKSAALYEFSTDDENKKAEETEDFIYNLRKGLNATAAPVPVVIAFSEEMSQLRQVMASRAKIPFRTPADFVKRKPRFSGLKLSGAAPAGGALQYLWPKARGFNLLASGLRDQQKRPFLVSLLLSGLLAIALAFYLFVPIQTEGKRLARIDGEISKRKSEVMSIEKARSEIEAINKRTALLDNFRQERPLYIALGRDLTERIPKNAWLTRVRITGSQLNIEGYANSATALIQLLEASKYFRNVEFSSPTFRDPQMNMDRFQIKMEIRERKKEAAADEKK
jgi:Tfp pilus assembly protein PilN